MTNLFGLGGGKDIYLSVSPACGLEMIELDKQGSIKSYAQAPLEYNEAQREIANYDSFKAALESLFAMRNINPAKANIHLSVPTVWFGAKEGLPLLLDDNGITNVVLGELEQTYIFKRTEPIPFWFNNLVSQNSDSRNIFYTAVQSSAINQIKDILTGMGATLVSVECSLFAYLKGLYFTGIASEQMQEENHSWNLMIINNSGYQMLGLQGKRILDYYEEPLAIKSYEGEELYTAINSSLEVALMNTPSDTLIIVSETDLVSAQALAGKIQFNGQVIFVDDNKFRHEPIMEMSLNILSDDQIKVSLHSIGHTSPAGVMPVDVNFISDGKTSVGPAVIEIPVGNSVFLLTPAKACVILLILGALILTPLLLIHYLTQDKLAKAQEKSSELDSRITQVEEQIKALQASSGKTEFDIFSEIERVLKNNRIKIMAYAALGESIPKNIYLTYFLTGDDGKINIKGCADSVEEVYVFFKNLKDSLVDSQIRLSKLDLKNSDSVDKLVNDTVSTVDDAPYIFEITNMSENELKLFKNGLGAKKQENENNKNESQAENDSNNKN